MDRNRRVQLQLRDSWVNLLCCHRIVVHSLCKQQWTDQQEDRRRQEDQWVPVQEQRGRQEEVQMNTEYVENSSLGASELLD